MKIVICDDNKEEQNRYAKMLSEIIQKHQMSPISFEFYNTGKDLINNWVWDNNSLLFLDIHMPEMEGMEAANLLRQKGYRGEIVFLTVSKKHVVEAFEVEAFHYLLKEEVEKQKLEEVTIRAYKQVQEKKRKYITLSRKGDIRNIALDSIYYFEMKNRIITVHYGSGEAFSFYSTMDKLEKKLAGEEFLRVHRSYIAGISKIKKSEQEKEVCLLGEKRLPLGTRYITHYTNILKGYQLC